MVCRRSELGGLIISADVMNIIMAVIGLVGLKRAPECIKMHHFEGENAKFFLGRGSVPPDPTVTGEGDTPSPDPIPVDAFGASIRVPSALDPPPQTTFLDTGLPGLIRPPVVKFRVM